jgi:hypothetical protein
MGFYFDIDHFRERDDMIIIYFLENHTDYRNMRLDLQGTCISGSMNFKETIPQLIH